MRYLHVLMLCCGVASLALIAQIMRPAARCPPRPAVDATAASAAPCEDRAPEGDVDGCLQQAIWGKCGEPFMKRCDKSCGRCSSMKRADALRRVTIVSARQAAPCATPDGDAWVMRAQQNKAEFARIHGMQLSWTSAQVDPQYDGAWNKLALLARLMNQSLERQGGRPPGGEPRSKIASRAVNGGGTRGTSSGGEEWLFWVDWDVIFTDLSVALPLEEYEASGTRLVLGGEPKGVFEERDYLKLNTGVMLLRVHSWSLALLHRMLAVGRKAARRRHAIDAQKVVRNLCTGCIDDRELPPARETPSAGSDARALGLVTRLSSEAGALV